MSLKLRSQSTLTKADIENTCRLTTYLPTIAADTTLPFQSPFSTRTPKDITTGGVTGSLCSLRINSESVPRSVLLYSHELLVACDLLMRTESLSLIRFHSKGIAWLHPSIYFINISGECNYSIGFIYELGRDDGKWTSE